MDMHSEWRVRTRGWSHYFSIIIITDVNWTSEGKYISAMHNQSQGNAQYTVIIRTQVTYKV